MFFSFRPHFIYFCIYYIKYIVNCFLYIPSTMLMFLI